MNFSKDFSKIEIPSNRKFGFFFAAVFVAVGIYFYLAQGEGAPVVAYLFFALATAFILTTLIAASALLPLNKLWMRFGFLLGMIVSPIVLGFIFFGLFTPISLLMRLFGRDELRLKLNNRKSHWKKRDEERETDAFNHQF